MDNSTGEEIVRARKDKWVARWFDALMRTYPEESARFFKDTRDPFANPVGATLEKGIRDLFEVVTADTFDNEAAKTALEPMVRVRAIQEMSPSEALGFITEIKAIVKQDAAADSRKSTVAEKARCIVDNADKALLTAFDLYMDCKKRVYHLRARQARDSVRQLLVKKELISELPDIDPELT
ncbi:MAG: RsbRD N-terminal domain-containing protein [Desulfobacteraceae bacterium]|nr:RsbRD N-terminal domain-containing protein [Desulfobacteraceae bacterium]MCF8095156.1 RsbRD N-terminal domain-containing protein [Desulfobacteraceae bacterium]